MSEINITELTYKFNLCADQYGFEPVSESDWVDAAPVGGCPAARLPSYALVDGAQPFCIDYIEGTEYLENGELDGAWLARDAVTKSCLRFTKDLNDLMDYLRQKSGC